MRDKKLQQQESQRHKSRVRSLGSRSVDASTLIRSRLSLLSSRFYIDDNISCLCLCVLLKRIGEKKSQTNKEGNNWRCRLIRDIQTDLCAPLSLLLALDLCVCVCVFSCARCFKHNFGIVAPWWDYPCSDYYYYLFRSPMPLYGRKWRETQNNWNIAEFWRLFDWAPNLKKKKIKEGRVFWLLLFFPFLCRGGG